MSTIAPFPVSINIPSAPEAVIPNQVAMIIRSHVSEVTFCAILEDLEALQAGTYPEEPAASPSRNDLERPA